MLTFDRRMKENDHLSFRINVWGFTLANIASAKKRARTSEKSRIQNAAARSRLRTYIKKVLHAVAAGDVDKAQAAFREATPVIDSSVNKGLIHRNKAARSKSRLNARIKALSLKTA
jgi:small subunit ribosomal protein S20